MKLSEAFKEALDEVDVQPSTSSSSRPNSSQNGLQLFVNLLKQNYKTDDEKIKALVLIARISLGKKASELQKALYSTDQNRS